MTRFLVVPQWQGSASPRAMRLIDGARAIAGDLPRSATITVEVPLAAGETLETGVRRFSSLRHAADAQREATTVREGEHAVAIGGDAGVATTAALLSLGGPGPPIDQKAVVIWFAAHPGFHGPGSSPTGAFDSMAARAIVDVDVPLISTGSLLSPTRLVLAGARAADAAEIEAATRMGAVLLPRIDAAEIVAAVSALEPTVVFVHVALDVLDPAAIAGVTAPEPFGADVGSLTAAIGAVRALAPTAGAALTGFAPASASAAVEDLGAVLRVLGALA